MSKEEISRLEAHEAETVHQIDRSDILVIQTCFQKWVHAQSFSLRNMQKSLIKFPHGLFF